MIIILLKQFKKVFHCEMNEDLSKIVSHNYTVLNQNNITCLQGDSFDSFRTIKHKF